MTRSALALLMVLSGSAFAGLPRSALPSVQLAIYGIYTSSDPSCQTGLIATVPISATATLINLVSEPTFGTGTVPTNINCVIIVMRNYFSATWAAGTYTTSTNGNPDSVCNAGGTNSGHACNGVDSDKIVWPEQIRADLLAAGLTAGANCLTSDTNMPVPLTLSTNSFCTGNTVDDATVPACAANGTSQFQAPAAAETAATASFKGMKLTNPGNKDTYTFFVDPDGYVGPDNLGPSTCILGGLKFGFR